MAKKQPKKVEALRHREAARKHIPTAEYRAVLADEDRNPVQVAYERRNRDLDPQLVWRGKDQQDEQDLTVHAPPLYIQEKVQPKVLIDDLARHSKAAALPDEVIDLFADFNGLPEDATETEFYEHDANWSNRMILGDSLQVMASLAEREDLRGKVQCIYFDPPYGIKFNSNFQWSTTSRVVTDGKAAHITREPEQVKAFRDTWRDGIHSYLTYLRDRLSVAHDLLTTDGSIFVQIGDENVHRVRSLMDEVFGSDGYVSLITYKTSIGLGAQALDNTCNYLIWYCKNKDSAKFRRLYRRLEPWKEGATRYKTIRSPDLTQRRVTKRELLGLDSLRQGARLFRDVGLTSRGASRTTVFPVQFSGDSYRPSVGGWRTSEHGMRRVVRADRVMRTGRNLSFRKYFDDFSAIALDSFWVDVSGGITSRADPKIYVVQTSTKVVERCLLMATDPGDLVLDPTCGAGTTAYVAEHWGRRWVTIDTSRVALALARSRIMGARYPYYLLADSPAGAAKEAEIRRTVRRAERTFGDIRQGFVYERVPHITLRVIANNSEIDVIWEHYQETLEPLREKLNALLGTEWEEWEIPRQAGDDWESDARSLHEEWWKARIARQKEIDVSIAANAPFEYLYDKPYEDKKTVRVAGPFTVESLSPHRVLAVDAEDELLDQAAERPSDYGERQDFASMILDQLRTAGVQQAHKADRIDFTSVTGWPGDYVCAMGQYMEAGRARRAGILIGPEFGTVSRPDLVAAAKEAAEAGFDSVVACAFNYDARSADFVKVGRVPILKARMNADLHMADELKNTGAGNLFVIFGEPDIDILSVDDEQIQVEVKGVDVFDPGTGEVRSDDTDGIACWLIDTDYNEESFFVRHAYFLGANDPYKALKTTLKAEIDADAWASLRSNVSRPFPKPESGRIAVKVINHLGDEVMKVFRV
jgi:adenine-specific DNA-methyltransferase